MKKMIIVIENTKEAEVLQTALFKAGGSWIDSKKTVKNTNSKYFFITSELIVSSSSDVIFFNSREEHETPLSEALIIFDSLVEKLPFLTRSGVKANLPYKIDSYIKDQYITMCNHNGIDITRRIENLIAADIKARIYGKDLIEVLKKLMQ